MNPTRAHYEDRIKQIMDSYQKPLVAYADGILHDVDAARDVVQEAFIRLVRTEAREEVHAPKTWLYRTSRNLAIDRLRKAGRMIPLEGDGRETAATARAESPLAHASHKDDSAYLLALVGRLPARQQELLRLRYQGELSYRRMSEVTGLSVSNVGYLLHQAIQQLRKMFAAEDHA
jgi:RNA polymerase sigma-70 factor (ECF subfamily)